MKKLHQTILPVIIKAEEILLNTFHTEEEVLSKDSVAIQATDVTKSDEQVDELLRHELSRLFPDFGFITEEGVPGELKEYNWIIDPKDGTTNHVHGFPMFGISVALWHENEPVYGCISIPKFGERLHGWKGRGVFLNCQPLSNGKRDGTSKPYVLLAPVAKPEEHARIITSIAETLTAPRDFGCCVYQASMVIQGYADVMVMYNLALWDIGAAVLLAKEQGLAVEYITPVPDIYSTNTKAYAHHVVIGKTEYVTKLVKDLKKNSAILSPN